MAHAIDARGTSAAPSTLDAGPVITGPSGGWPASYRRATGSERLLAAWVFLLLVAFSPELYASFWAPKAALLLLVVVPGAVALVDAARTGVRGARWAVAFLVVAGVAAFTADTPLLSLLGGHGWGTGWLFLASLAGLWALGTRLRVDGRVLIGAALLTGAVASAAVAWIQAAFELPVEVLDPGGRSQGLQGNPVHLGTVAAAGLWLAAVYLRSARRSWPLLAGGMVLIGAVQFSGSRAALALTFIVVCFGAWRLGVRRGAAFVLAVVIGFGLAGMVDASSGQATATARAAASLNPGSSSGRFAAWEASPSAVADQPLFGWGPGRFQAATSPEVGPEVARFEGAGAEYTDAHNWVLELSVTTGLVGLLLFAGWIVGAAREARHPLVGVALVGAGVGLVQPLSVAVTPLLFLALGASMSVTGRPGADSRWPRGVVSGLTGVAVIAAGIFTIGELELANAALDFSRPAVRTADRLLPAWPQVSDVAWRIEAYHAITERDDQAWERALEHAREAARRDPAASGAWVDLGDLALRRERTAEARAAYDRALERYPFNRRALAGRIALADREGDEQRVETLCGRLHEVVELDESCVSEIRERYGNEVEVGA